MVNTATEKDQLEQLYRLPHALRLAVTGTEDTSLGHYLAQLRSGQLVRFRGAHCDNDGWIQLLSAQPVGKNDVEPECFCVRLAAIDWAAAVRPSMN